MKTKVLLSCILVLIFCSFLGIQLNCGDTSAGDTSANNSCSDDCIAQVEGMIEEAISAHSAIPNAHHTPSSLVLVDGDGEEIGLLLSGGMVGYFAGEYVFYNPDIDYFFTLNTLGEMKSGYIYFDGLNCTGNAYWRKSGMEAPPLKTLFRSPNPGKAFVCVVEEPIVIDTIQSSYDSRYDPACKSINLNEEFYPLTEIDSPVPVDYPLPLTVQAKHE